MIQINVTAQCQATTYKGTQCTKEATVLDQITGEESVQLVTAFTEQVKYDERAKGGQYTKREKLLGMKHWSHGFHCNTHSYAAQHARSKKFYANYGVNG